MASLNVHCSELSIMRFALASNPQGIIVLGGPVGVGVIAGPQHIWPAPAQVPATGGPPEAQLPEAETQELGAVHVGATGLHTAPDVLQLPALHE